MGQSENQKFNYHGQIQFLINLVQLLLYTLHKVSTNGTASGSRLVQSQGVVAKVAATITSILETKQHPLHI